jgi:hypothetical protein
MHGKAAAFLTNTFEQKHPIIRLTTESWPKNYLCLCTATVKMIWKALKVG